LAFESAALAPTEMTELQPRPNRRAALIALGGIAAIAAVVYARGTPGGGAASPPAAEHPTATRKRVPTPAPVAPATSTGAPAIVPATPAVESAARKRVVDSATLRARRARRDSIRAAAAAAAAIKPGSVHAAIMRYAHAIDSASVSKMKDAYPNLTDEQQKSWEKNVFARATRIRTSVHFGHVKEDKNTAEADFVLHVTYDLESSKGSTQLRQHALLTKTPKGWQITEIKSP
jgi:hypothetical protein